MSKLLAIGSEMFEEIPKDADGKEEGSGFLKNRQVNAALTFGLSTVLTIINIAAGKSRKCGATAIAPLARRLKDFFTLVFVLSDRYSLPGLSCRRCQPRLGTDLYHYSRTCHNP